MYLITHFVVKFKHRNHSKKKYSKPFEANKREIIMLFITTACVIILGHRVQYELRS